MILWDRPPVKSKRQAFRWDAKVAAYRPVERDPVDWAGHKRWLRRFYLVLACIGILYVGILLHIILDCIESMW